MRTVPGSTLPSYVLGADTTSESTLRRSLSMTQTKVTPSLLKTWGKCARQVWYGHILRIKAPPGIAQSFGTSLHKTLIEGDQANRILTGAYLPIGQLQEDFSKDFDERIIETDPFDRDAVDMGGHVAARDTLQRWGLKAIDKYNENRDLLSARAVEQPFSIPFGDGWLEGRFDLDVSPNVFKDLKTRDLSRPRSRKVGAPEVQHDHQFAAYAAAKARLEKEPVVGYSQVTIYKREAPLIEEVPAARGPAQHEAIELYAQEVQKSIQAGAFPPVDKSTTNGWVCQQRYCGWHAATLPDGSPGCPWGARSQVQV